LIRQINWQSQIVYDVPSKNHTVSWQSTKAQRMSGANLNARSSRGKRKMRKRRPDVLLGLHFSVSTFSIWNSSLVVEPTDSECSKYGIHLACSDLYHPFPCGMCHLWGAEQNDRHSRDAKTSQYPDR